MIVNFRNISEVGMSDDQSVSEEESPVYILPPLTSTTPH